jgi:aspartate/methionine/tyrosine aminotransferase
MQIASRADSIAPFYVMEVAKAAAALAATAPVQRPVVFLNIGEPDFTAPPLVQEAAIRAIQNGQTQYTPALGLDALRERLSHWYAQHFGLTVPAQRIVITSGASAALQLACLALFDAGTEVLMPDPCYPCNRQFVRAVGAEAVLLPTTAEQRFQLHAEQVRTAWNARTRGVLLASPSNPTGTSIHPNALRDIHAAVQEHGGVTVVDEIYLPLSFDATYRQSALAIDDAIISINSFSKYFHMTGWRLGWMVVPEPLVPVVERLAQNLYIAPSTVAQHAALACFAPESLAVFEQRRTEFQTRRDYFIPQLRALGLQVPVIPDGAFYAWADCTELCQQLGLTGSWDFSFSVLERAFVAITPGRDFSQAQGNRFVRFSTANSMEQLQLAIERLRQL